jgi:hypothetical protein
MKRGLFKNRNSEICFINIYTQSSISPNSKSFIQEVINNPK